MSDAMNPIQAAEDVRAKWHDDTADIWALADCVEPLIKHARTLEAELARKTAVADAYWEIVESYKAENAALSHPAGEVGKLVEELRALCDPTVLDEPARRTIGQTIDALTSLTSVSEEDVGRVAGELVRQSSGNRALERFRDLLFSHRHEIVRAALTAFVRG